MMTRRRWIISGVVAVVLVAGLAASGAALLRDDDPAAQPSRIDRYVALGDSYTAAPGVGEPVSGSCRRSSSNYPTQVATELDIEVFIDNSCSSATTLDMLRPQRPGVPPQLESLTAGTDLVTVGIGANDFALFAQLLLRCGQMREEDPDGSPCRDSDTAAGRTQVLKTIERTRHRLARLFEEIRTRAPEATVLVVGYPHVVDPGTYCPERLPLAAGDVDHLDAMLERLGEATREAAEEAGFTYLDVREVSRGHGICSDDPWINDDTGEEGKGLQFHPFLAHQEAVAELVLDQLR